MNYEPHVTRYPDGTCVLASIGSNDTCNTGTNDPVECILRSGIALKSVSSTPLPVPKTDGTSYEILLTSTMGLRMFASRDIQKGELILAERPLIVMPKSPYPSIFDVQLHPSFDWDDFIKPAFDRLTPENQAMFYTLANSPTKNGGGPLYGVFRMNGFCIEFGAGIYNQYPAVYKDLSRINHRYESLCPHSAQLQRLTHAAAADRTP
jgi:hypothetical protein